MKRAGKNPNHVNAAFNISLFCGGILSVLACTWALIVFWYAFYTLPWLFVLVIIIYLNIVTFGIYAVIKFILSLRNNPPLANPVKA